DRDEPDFDLRLLRIGHAVRTPKTKTAPRPAGRMPTVQDAVVQATDRLWPALTHKEPAIGLTPIEEQQVCQERKYLKYNTLWGSMCKIAGHGASRMLMLACAA